MNNSKKVASPDHSEKLNQTSNSIQQNETEDLKSPDDNQPSNTKPDALVELRKRESVLKALRKCLAA